MKTVRRTVPAALLLLAALAGCGGDDGEGKEPSSSLTTDEQTAADNLASQIVRSGSMAEGDAQNAVTEDQATCIAEGAVGEVGLAELQEYGIVTDDLLVNKSIQGVQMNGEDADALAGVFIDCIDAEGLFEERFVAAMTKGGAKAARACVEEAVDVDAVQDVLSASFQGSSTAAYAKMQKDVSSCGDGKGADQ